MSALRKASLLEDIYAHEQEVMFKAEARRNKLIGLWAAATMGRDNAENYADTLVAEDIANPHGLLTRLHNDFAAAGVAVLDDDIQSRMTSLLKDVVRDMRNA
jgi:hypothetical protein